MNDTVTPTIKPGRKQARRGAKPGDVRNPKGRPKGTPNKITGASILAEIAKYDLPFEQGLALDYARARQGNDGHLIIKYQQMLLNKVVADKTEITINNEQQIDMIMDMLLQGTATVTPTLEHNPSDIIDAVVTTKQGVKNGKKNN